jgi:hypothetical protein
MEDRSVKNPLDYISLLVILSGVLLIPLLPIGLWLGFDNFAYQATFILHLCFQIFAVIYAIRYFLKILGRSGINYFFYGGALILFFSICAVQTITPITAKDALIHHLYLPKLWLHEGHIVETSWHVWSYYPQLIQLGYAGLMRLALGHLSALYHFSFLLPLAAVSAFFISSHFESKRLGIWAFLITLSMPLFIRLSGEPLVDIPLALYCSVAIALLVESCESRFAGQRILGAGVALGLALSTKYNGLLAVAIILATLPLYCARMNIKSGAIIRMGIFLTFVAGAIYSPWLIRNYHWTSNPIYPFLSSNIEADSADSDAAKMSHLEQRFYLYGETPADLITIPFRMIMGGKDESPAHFDAVLSPFFLLVFLSVLPTTNKPWRRWSIFIVVSYFLAAILLAGARTRYLVPIWLPALGLSFVGLDYLKTVFPIRGKSIKSVIFGIHIIWAFFYSYSYLERQQILPYLTNNETEASYLKRNIFEYQVIENVNNLLSDKPEARIYLLGTGNRFLYFKNNVIGGHFSEAQLVKVIKNKGSGLEVAEAIKKEGITHFLVHKDRASILLGLALNEVESQAWQAYINDHLHQIFTENGYSLLEVK